MATFLQNQINAANANEKTTRKKKELDPNEAALNDYSNWKVVGAGIVDKDLDQSKSALARMMEAGTDEDGAYDRAYRASMNDNSSDVLTGQLRDYMDSFGRDGGVKAIADALAGQAAKAPQYGGGGYTGNTYQTQNTPAGSSVDTSDLDKQIRDLTDKMYMAQGLNQNGEAEAYQRQIHDLEQEKKKRTSDTVLQDYFTDNKNRAAAAGARKGEQLGLTQDGKPNTPEADTRTLQQGRAALQTGAQQEYENRMADILAGNKAAAMAQSRDQRVANQRSTDEIQADIDAITQQLYNPGARYVSVEQAEQQKALQAQAQVLNRELEEARRREETAAQRAQREEAQAQAALALEAEIQTYSDFSKLSTEDLEAQISMLAQQMEFAQNRQAAARQEGLEALLSGQIGGNVPQETVDTNAYQNANMLRPGEYGGVERTVNSNGANAEQAAKVRQSIASISETRYNQAYERAQKWADEESRLRALLEEAQKQLAEKQRYDASLSDETRRLIQDTINARKYYSDTQEVARGYAENVQDRAEAYDAAKHAVQRNESLARAYAHADQKYQTAVQNYKAAEASGADAETLSMLAAQVDRLQEETSAAYEFLYLPYEQSVEELGRTAKELSAAQYKYELTGKRLEDRAGAYYKAYDALSDNLSGAGEYHKAYQNMLGLTALIDGYQEKLDALYLEQKELFMNGEGDSPRAQQIQAEISEYDAKVVSWMTERADNYAYAYQYDYTRTLSELSDADRALFDKVAKYRYLGGSLDKDGKVAQDELLDKYGESEYARILEMVQRAYNQNETEQRRRQIQKDLEKYGVAGGIAYSLGSVFTNLLSAPGAVYEVVRQGLTNSGTYRPFDTNTIGFLNQNITQEIRGLIGENIDDETARMLYSTVMSGIDSAAAMLVGNYVGAGLSALSESGLSIETIHNIGGYLLGATAASATMQDIAERGGSFTQVVTGGVMAGIFECFFEEYSIENFYALEGSSVTGAKDFIKNIGKSMLTNASEETWTEIANIAYDALFLGDASEWRKAHEENLSKGMTEWESIKALAIVAGKQVAEAGISGAIMGAGFGAVASAQSLRENASIFRNVQRLVAINDRLPGEYHIDISYNPGTTTAEDVQKYAERVYDAWTKYNADMKAQETAHPAETQAIKDAAENLAAVNVRTVSNVENAAVQAEAGAEAGRADAANAQEAARIAQDDVSRETAGNTAEAETERPVEAQREAVPMDDEYAQDLRNTAETTLDNLEGAFSGDVLRANVEEQMQEWRETEGQIGEDKAAALENLYNERYNNSGTDETVSPTMQGNPSAEQNTTVSQTQTNTLTADEQGTVDRTVDSIMAATTNADGSIDVEVARDLSQNGTIQFRDDGRGYIADAIINGVESRIAGGNENALLYDNERERGDGTNSARQSGRVAERSGEAEGAAERGAESGRQTGAEQSRTGEAGGSDEVSDSSVRDMSELDKDGYPGEKVSVTTDSPEHIALREQANADGVDLVIVNGPLYFKTKTGKKFKTNGAYNPATNRIYVQADFVGYSAEEIYKHELFHMRRAQNGAMYAEVKKLVRSLYKGELSDVLKEYRGLYKLLGDVSDDYLLEELCADCYAGMDRFERDQSYYADDVQKIVDKYEYDTSAVEERQQETKYNTNTDFKDQLYQWNEDGRPENEQFNLGSTGDVLQALGAIEQDIYMMGDKIEEILTSGKHPEMTLEDVTHVPEILDDPVLILASKGKNADGDNYRLVIFGSYNAANGLPVMCTLDLHVVDNHVYIDDMQKVNSAYTKTKNPAGFISSSDVMFYENKRIARLLRQMGLQSRPIASQTSDSYVGSISYDNRTVNITGVPFSKLFVSDENSGKSAPRYSASSTDDLIDAIEAGEREADNGKDATTKQKAGAVSANMTLDERAQAAYDKALANGDKARAEEISKMRAAQHKASDLRRETRMAKAAYERSGSTEDFVRYNNLRNESNRANREYRNLTNQLGDEMAAELTPKQAIRRTENLIIDEFHVPSGFRAQSRKAVRDLLNQIYADGEINETDVDRVIRSMFDIGTEYTQPDPVYASIRDELRGQRIYVDPSIRAEYGDDWANTRQRFFAHGVYLVSDMSKADPNATVDSVYTGMTGDYPAQMPESNTDGRAQLDAMLDALDQGRVTGQNYFEALAESQHMSIDDVYDLVYEKVSGILNEYGRLADIETHIHQRSDAEMLEAKTRFNEKTEMARERRNRADALRKIDNILSRIYKRAKENGASFTRVANEQDSVMRERMEDALNKLNSVAVSMFGFDITDSARLAEWMDQYAKSYAGFDPSGSLREAAKTLSEIGSGDTLTVEDLDFLYDMLRRIDHALAMANEMMDDSRGSLGGVAEDMRDQTKALRGVKKYVTNLRSRLRPIFNEESLSYARNLRRYGGWNPHSVMAWMADRAERSDMDYMKYKDGADMILLPFLNRRNNEARRDWLYKAAGKNAEFVDVEIPKLLADGTAAPGETMKIRVNQMMLVQMYLDLRNEDNLRHIEYGGYTIPDEQMYKKGQNKQAYDSGTKNVRMTAATMQRIVNENLAAEGKEFAELLDKYYNEYAKPLINATSRAIDGVDKAVNPHYYPIRNDKNYHASSYNIYNGTLENMGPLKERVKGARNAIYLADADETFQWHKELMAKYTGYAKLLRDFKALMNFDAGGDMTNEAVLVDKFGQGARQFVSNFFENLETGKIEDAKTLSKIMGNYISSVLNANISSMLKQFAALPLAGSTYGMEPITYAIAHMGRRVDPNFVRKYTAYLDERADTMAYDQITDIVRKKAGSAGAISAATALGRNWLEFTDYQANKMLWIAAEHYVDTHFAGLQKGTQEEIDNGESPYYKKVAQVFDKMTFDTQTNANTMAKPDILRRVDSGIKAFTLFKTDAFQVQGIIREAVGQYRWAKQNGDAADVKAAGQKLYHALQGVFVSSVVQAMMAAIAKGLRRRDDEFKDEDGNLDFGKVGKRLAIDTGENIFGAVLFGSTLYTWIWSLIDKDEKFYDIEAASLSVVTDLLSAIGKNGQKIFETLQNWNAAENKDANFWEAHKDDLLKPIYNLAKQISTFAGIPWSNIEKNLIGWLGMAWPEVAVALSDEWTEYDKTSLEGKHGEELEARMKAYISDELGIVSDAMLAEYVRLYEVFGEDLKPSLPSANEPTVYDEDGKKRDLTPEESATWDSAYRTTMIDLVNDFAESESFMSLTDDEKKTVLAKALAYAKEVAKGDIGLKTASYVGKVQNATENGADMSNALLYYALQAGCAGIKDDNGKTIDKSKLLNQFNALEDMDIPDEQKAAIYHAMYQSTGSAWKDAAATMNDQEFLAYAREQFADIQAKVDRKIGTQGEQKQAVAPTIEPQTAQAEPAQAVSTPEPEQPKADPLQPEYDKAVSAGMSEDGAKAAVQAVKAAGGDEAKERAKQAAAVGVLDSVEDQLAAVRYYSEKPEANYARFSRANDYGVTPADFFSFWGDLSAKYDTTPKQTEAQAVLDSRTDLTQEQKAAMWQLCGARWDASKNPYAVYVGDQVREAYYAND